MPGELRTGLLRISVTLYWIKIQYSFAWDTYLHFCSVFAEGESLRELGIFIQGNSKLSTYDCRNSLCYIINIRCINFLLHCGTVPHVSLI